MAVLTSQTAKLPEQTAQTTVTQTMVNWGVVSCFLPPVPCPHCVPGLSLTVLSLQMKALREKLQRVLKVLRLWRKAPEQ